MVTRPRPSTVFPTWVCRAPATPLSQDDYLYLSAKASADIFGHEIEIGFQYDQMWESSYSLSAYNIWTLMRNYANSHISQMDLDNPIYETRGSQLYVNYNRKLDAAQQTYFDRAFRDYLISNNFTNTDGSAIDEYTWIDVDRYMPEDFVRAGGVSMFSTDELFNSGNGAYASYYGYDHTGEKYDASNWSLDKFFNPSDGKYRYLPAFSPIYAAGYIQDKFYFQDLIFNIGVRVDYFNGNQYVMKDPYLLYESYTVAQIRKNPSLIGGGGQYLNNAGDDWVPYVDQVSNAEGANKPIIKGYRDPMASGTMLMVKRSLRRVPSTVLPVSPLLTIPREVSRLSATVRLAPRLSSVTLPRLWPCPVSPSPSPLVRNRSSRPVTTLSPVVLPRVCGLPTMSATSSCRRFPPSPTPT